MLTQCTLLLLLLPPVQQRERLSVCTCTIVVVVQVSQSRHHHINPHTHTPHRLTGEREAHQFCDNNEGCLLWCIFRGGPYLSTLSTHTELSLSRSRCYVFCGIYYRERISAAQAAVLSSNCASGSQCDVWPLLFPPPLAPLSLSLHRASIMNGTRSSSSEKWEEAFNVNAEWNNSNWAKNRQMASKLLLMRRTRRQNTTRALPKTPLNYEWSGSSCDEDDDTKRECRPGKAIKVILPSLTSLSHTCSFDVVVQLWLLRIVVLLLYSLASKATAFPFFFCPSFLPSFLFFFFIHLLGRSLLHCPPTSGLCCMLMMMYGVLVLLLARRLRCCGFSKFIRRMF